MIGRKRVREKKVEERVRARDRWRNRGQNLIDTILMHFYIFRRMQKEWATCIFSVYACCHYYLAIHQFEYMEKLPHQHMITYPILITGRLAKASYT